MNKKLFLALASALLVMASCNNDSIYKGFEKTESGAYMKFYEKGDSDQMPRIGDGVTVEMAQYFNDSLLLSTVGDRPLEIRVGEASFVGDVPDALRMMHIGDSVRLVVLADSVLLTMMQMEEVPEEFAGLPIYYDMKLLAIKPFEEIEAQRKALLDSLQTVENDYLIGLQAEKQNSVTESGLIVLEKTGKGRVAKLGEYVNFDFTMLTKDGDTLLSSFGVESVEMQLGEEFVSKGVDEGLGMVPEGGTMRYVVPSNLAFDSTGYEGMIAPYAPIVMTLRMNSIMDEEAYAKKQAAIEAEKAAKAERQKAIEKELIANYIKENGITEEPTESGLYILRREEGEGNVAQWGEQVAVHYVLKTLKGETVESSYDYDQPIEFALGKGEMIPAIEEALMTMSPGAKVTLITPSELAFGEYEIDADLLPAYSPMVVELELVEIK